MAKTIQCDIVSVEGSIYSGAVASVSATGIEGEFCVMPGHTPFLTQLRAGTIALVGADGEPEVFYVSGGMVEVQPKLVSILADSAERAANIDEAAAEKAKQEALDLLADHSSDMDFSLAAIRLAEATAQLRALQKLRK